MKIARMFLFFGLLLLCSFSTLHAAESLIAFDDYKIEETPREGNIARKLVIATDWKGAMPVRGGYRTYEITVPTLQMKQGDILSLELICPQQKKGSPNARCNSTTHPSWKIVTTELNDDATSYLCDLIVIGPKYHQWHSLPHPQIHATYEATFCFRSIGKTGHFELEYTIPNLFTDAYDYLWTVSLGKLVIRVPVDIEPASSKAQRDSFSI